MTTLRELDVANKMVFLRVDFNVPLKEDGRISDDNRIKAALPTIQYLQGHKAKIIIASHLGRPKGKIVEKYSLQSSVTRRLSELLGQAIKYSSDCVGEQVEEMKRTLQSGEILMLENLRFHSQEEKNDEAFAKELGKNVDVYVNDAFGVSHRKHASIHALARQIQNSGIGFLMEEEIVGLSKLLHNPQRPFVLIIGGAKISDKVDVIRALAPKSDVVLTGGGVANAFLKGAGVDVQSSLVEKDKEASLDVAGKDYAKVAAEIYKEFGENNHIRIPVDAVCAKSSKEGEETKIVEFSVTSVPTGWMILDIGPKTQAQYAEIIKEAKTIMWNGPMGVFEQKAYEHGSRAVAEAIANTEAYKVIGGGDSEMVVEKFDLVGKFSHISTGGGASLEFLANGGTLPGLEVLK